jgi:hypothetical protein
MVPCASRRSALGASTSSCASLPAKVHGGARSQHGANASPQFPQKPRSKGLPFKGMLAAARGRCVE